MKFRLFVSVDRYIKYMVASYITYTTLWHFLPFYRCYRKRQAREPVMSNENRVPDVIANPAFNDSQTFPKSLEIWTDTIKKSRSISWHDHILLLQVMIFLIWYNVLYERQSLIYMFGYMMIVCVGRGLLEPSNFFCQHVSFWNHVNVVRKLIPFDRKLQ